MIFNKDSNYRKIYLIEWQDAHANSGWFTHEEANEFIKHDKCICQEIGWILSENKNKALNDKEKEFVSTIYSSGADLLELINEILDLSKIEAGKLDTEIVECSLAVLLNSIESLMRPTAKEKNLDFKVIESEGLRLIERLMAEQQPVVDRREDQIERRRHVQIRTQLAPRDAGPDDFGGHRPPRPEPLLPQCLPDLRLGLGVGRQRPHQRPGRGGGEPGRHRPDCADPPCPLPSHILGRDPHRQRYRLRPQLHDAAVHSPLCQPHPGG